jgi:hypothetical protein
MAGGTAIEITIRSDRGETDDQKQTAETFERTYKIRVQRGQRNTKAREEFGDFSDVGKLAFTRRKKLPEEVDAQGEQQRRL